MTAPSAPIDSDLVEGSRDIFYVLEEASVWKTSNLSEAGAATWAEVWIEGALLGGTLGGLLRVRCAPGSSTLVYVLGWGEKPDGKNYPFVLRSASAGTTWSEHWLDEEIDIGAGAITWGAQFGVPGNSPLTLVGAGAECVCTVVFDGSKQYPGANGEIYINLPEDLALGSLTISYDVIGTCPSAGFDTDGDLPPYIDGQLVPYCSLSFTPISGGYHAAGTIVTNLMPDRGILRLGYWGSRPGKWAGYAAATRVSTFKNLTIDGVTYKDPMPKAFDVSRTNNNWLYLGLEDKIMKSEDGAFTWETLTEDHGANDIVVDPQAGGAIYYWGSDGSLWLRVAGVLQDVLLVDSALNQHGRIARAINSGKLWVIDASGNVRMRESGAWTTQVSASAGGKALRAYLGTPAKVVYVDSDDIHLSTDGGATWALKKGGWGGDYADPVGVHLMAEGS